jgi:hypothetical protein
MAMPNVGTGEDIMTVCYIQYQKMAYFSLRCFDVCVNVVEGSHGRVDQMSKARGQCQVNTRFSGTAEIHRQFGSENSIARCNSEYFDRNGFVMGQKQLAVLSLRVVEMVPPTLVGSCRRKIDE